MKEPSAVGPHVVFNAARDNIYLAIVLLGVGGATVLVLSFTMISQVVGKYAVSHSTSLASDTTPASNCDCTHTARHLGLSHGPAQPLGITWN